MIHFRAQITSLSNKTGPPLVGIALTPADLGLITGGHPLFLDLWKAGVPDAKMVGVYFVRDSKELVAVLQRAGLDEVAIAEAGIALDGKQVTPKPLPKEKEEFFR
jgi:hypothetical protein